MKKLFLILALAIFIISCGKKEETQTTPQENQQQMNQTQQQQQQQQQTQSSEQLKQDESKKDEMKKEDGKKEDGKKDADKKDADKKKEDKQTTEKKNNEETPKEKIETKNTSDIDFAPIFAKKCAKCHGKDLKGKKDGGPDLTAEKVQNSPDSKLIKIINDGVKAKNEDDENMPAWKNKLTEDEINAAVKFIKAH